MHQAVTFDARLLRMYDISGPRYTSYPTAMQFGETFDEVQYCELARASNDDPIPRPLSLYVHVPFCTSPCFYCGCTRIITREPVKGRIYLDHLLREIELQATLFDRDRVVEQLHLGGGTPTFLSGDQLGELLDGMRKHFRLCDDERREFSIEVDPRTVSAAGMQHLADLGFNRVSLGVQDFDPVVQAAVNRLQSVEETLGLVQAARRAGISSINMDLIHGLPFQSLEGFGRTLETVIGARPERLAVYSYAHLPRMFKAQRQIDERALPSAEAKLALLELAITMLTAAGYVYIGMDHFALPDDELVLAQRRGDLQRNFQGYSTRAECDMIGLGMSSIGKVGDSYSQNIKSLAGYQQALSEGRLPVMRGVRLNCDDLVRREIIQQLMCQGELDFAAVAERWEIDFHDYFATSLARLRRLATDGLVELSREHLTVTPRGRLLLRVVAMCFDRYQRTLNEERFSRVI